MALEYLGAGLKQDGHEVQLLDARFDSDVEATFRKVRPDVVGLTAYTVHVPWVRTIAERLKAADSDVFIVVGGHHATVRPEDFVRKMAARRAVPSLRGLGELLRQPAGRYEQGHDRRRATRSGADSPRSGQRQTPRIMHALGHGYRDLEEGERSA